VMVSCLFVLFGVVANLALSMAYQREIWFTTPSDSRVAFVNLQQRIDQSIFGGPPRGVTISRELPTIEPAGFLAILGDCAALYQSSGSNWIPIERSAAGGHYRLRASADRRQCR